MSRQTNKDIAQAVPLTEFVDSVFVDLNSWLNEDTPCYIAVPKCWKDVIIPLVVRLNELAQADLSVYWWLLQQMSEFDVCKDGEEYFGSGDVYALLLNLDGSRSRYILENSVPEHADELQEALKAEELDGFMSRMSVEEANALIYNICRVLKRVEDVRYIYKGTLSHAWGEPLGTLFLLTRRLFDYFAASYYDYHRPCDGMAYNFILALCHTPYHGDRDSFSELMNNLGDLWIKGLRMTYLSKKDQMPPLVSQAFFEVLHGDNAELLEQLQIKLNGCPESLKPSLIKSEEGWLELEKYFFVYERMYRGYSKPPFNWKRMPGGFIRIYREKVPGRYCVVDRIIRDNEPIPMEELKTLAISEKPANVVIANGDNGSVVNARGPLYPESKWGFIPDDYFEMRPGKQPEEYFDTFKFEVEYKKASLLENFVGLINYLAEEGYIPDNEETKALLAYRLTGLNRPEGRLEKIKWTGKGRNNNDKKSPRELYYLVKYWVRHCNSKNRQCKEFFVGPKWLETPSSKTKDCSRAFQRKLRDLYSIQPEYE